ncbi:MAG: hypothetical protein AAB334_01485 [Patescibacteria group bacterium]
MVLSQKVGFAGWMFGWVVLVGACVSASSTLRTGGMLAIVPFSETNIFSHRVLRTATKKRMFRKIIKLPTQKTIDSYKGLLKHGNTYKLKQALKF